ncbi:MAG: FlgD immunoglobulin-like domain containing protein [Candidatus Zixiibacteriota bacterium]
MKRLIPFVLVLALALTGFSGTVTGNLDFPEATETDTFLILITDQFEDILGAGAMGGALYPDYEFAVSGEFSDTVDYYAFAAIPGPAMIPSSGTPAGVYPESPFRTEDGNASGLVIPIASTRDIPGAVQWSGSFDNVYVNFYDLYQAYTTGDTVVEIENIEVGSDGTFLIEDCPSGPKAVMAYIDTNGNMMYDEDLEEPHAWLQNELMGVLVVGGGYEAEIAPEELDLDVWFVKESTPRPSELNIFASPNPFNGAVNFYYNIEKSSHCRISIYDSRGNLVNTIFNGQKSAGNHIVNWDGTGQFGQDLPAGSYNVQIATAAGSKSIKVLYIR